MVADRLILPTVMIAYKSHHVTVTSHHSRWLLITMTDAAASSVRIRWLKKVSALPRALLFDHLANKYRRFTPKFGFFEKNLHPWETVQLTLRDATVHPIASPNLHTHGYRLWLHKIFEVLMIWIECLRSNRGWQANDGNGSMPTADNPRQSPIEQGSYWGGFRMGCQRRNTREGYKLSWPWKKW